MNGLSFEEIYAAAKIIWGDKATAERITVQANSILNQAKKRKPSLFFGRRATVIIGGLFYLLSYRENKAIKQKELALKIGTSEMTIRASYRRWLLSFPDLFSDVASIMAQDYNLKYFVLSAYKKNQDEKPMAQIVNCRV